MIEVVDFRRSHMEKLIEQDNVAHLGKLMGDEHYTSLENDHNSKTILIGGKPILVGGLIMHSADKGEAWAILDENCKRYFVVIHNLVRKFLKLNPLPRIEAIVEIGFGPGHRWMDLLGFKLEETPVKGPGNTDKQFSRYIKESSNGC